MYLGVVVFGIPRRQLAADGYPEKPQGRVTSLTPGTGYNA
jgi:hypothetical protein